MEIIGIFVVIVIVYSAVVLGKNQQAIYDKLKIIEKILKPEE